MSGIFSRFRQGSRERAKVRHMSHPHGKRYDICRTQTAKVRHMSHPDGKGTTYVAPGRAKVRNMSHPDEQRYDICRTGTGKGTTYVAPGPAKVRHMSHPDRLRYDICRTRADENAPHAAPGRAKMRHTPHPAAQKNRMSACTWGPFHAFPQNASLSDIPGVSRVDLQGFPGNCPGPRRIFPGFCVSEAYRGYSPTPNSPWFFSGYQWDLLKESLGH